MTPSEALGNLVALAWVGSNSMADYRLIQEAAKVLRAAIDAEREPF